MKGLPVISVPLLLFSDDGSGNLSRKKWSKFDAWYLLLAGLPRADNAHLDSIHFLTCSNSVSALEMSLPEGLVTYDSHLKILNQQVLVVCPVLLTTNAEDLQKLINVVQEFCNKWRLKSNIEVVEGTCTYIEVGR